MKFTFTDSAMNYIYKKFESTDTSVYDILIDYLDGNSPYTDNVTGCHCQVYDKYRILIVSKEDKNIKWDKYDKELSTNIGTVYYPSYYEVMFNQDNKFDYSETNFTLYLKSEAGIITEQVQLIIKK